MTEEPDPPPETLLSGAPARARRREGASGPEPSLPADAGPTTIAVHGARRPERNAGAVVSPIYQTTTFHYPAEYSEVADPSDVRHYTRYENPSQEEAAETIRALEGAGAARVFSSGMAAISTTLLGLLRPGDTVVAPIEIYGGTDRLLREVLPKFGIGVRWLEPGAPEPTGELLEGASLLYLETPTNPLLRVRDIRAWARCADEVGALLLVDSTFATPVNQRPLELGADLVLHSATKYLAGHSDVLAGAVAGPSQLVDRLETMQRVLGGALDPHAAFLLQRGMKTLALRVARQNENAREVAEALARHPAVARVHYPGSHGADEEAIARTQMAGRGGLVSFELVGGRAASARFRRRLRLVHVATSLGGVESLVSAPRESSHAHLSPGEAERRGLPEGLLRLSCGIEETKDLLLDLLGALEPRAGDRGAS